MLNAHYRLVAALGTAAVTLSAGACSLAPDGPIPATAITRIQAFRCGIPMTDTTTSCQVRGVAVPLAELPPADEHFMVWVWHPGSNTTLWRLISSRDSANPVRNVTFDSAAVSYRLSGAPAKTYTVRVQILGITGVLAQDSLRWVFP